MSLRARKWSSPRLVVVLRLGGVDGLEQRTPGVRFLRSRRMSSSGKVSCHESTMLSRSMSAPRSRSAFSGHSIEFA
jgi:hypothetical protein